MLARLPEFPNSDQEDECPYNGCCCISGVHNELCIRLFDPNPNECPNQNQQVRDLTAGECHEGSDGRGYNQHDNCPDLWCNSETVPIDKIQVGRDIGDGGYGDPA